MVVSQVLNRMPNPWVDSWATLKCSHLDISGKNKVDPQYAGPLIFNSYNYNKHNQIKKWLKIHCKIETT